MEKIKEFISHCKDFAIATVDNHNHPRVRMFHLMKYDNQTMYFATARNKEVFGQLQNNPFIELVGWSQGIMFRTGGAVSFDVEGSLCREIYNSNTILSKIYGSFENPELVYFKLSLRNAELFNLTSLPPTREFIEMQ
ncbi:MAG: pyridoxamine 5'-phosphate oxidase family protein [Bacteroidetes bacterium]|nr:pyridoxamine 5'-phosphate oxidase family protein [Bacteroidota bacterium]